MAVSTFIGILKNFLEECQFNNDRKQYRGGLMKFHLYLLVLFSIIITGCANSDSMIQTALAETDANLPTNTTIPTHTAIPTNTIFPTNTPLPTNTDTRTPLPSDTPSPTYTSSPTDTSTPSATSTKIPTPTGPAEITASIPSSVPYERTSGGQCIWNITITFKEGSGVDATIEEIGNIFVSGKYKYYLGGEHKRDVDIFIPG